MSRNETLIQIEDLMIDICSGKYHWKNAIEELEYLFKTACDIYDPELDYSPLLEGYFNWMGISHSSGIGRPRKSASALFVSKTDFLNQCDDLIDKHERFIRRQQQQRRSNFSRLVDKFERLVARHCKLLLVRVDVSYQYEADIDIHQFNADLRRLRRRIQSRDTCFKDVLTYSWAIEQGREKGYHCHFLLIYNGSKCMRDGYYGEQMAEVWQDITGGDGYSFNCNRKGHKDNYRRFGTLGIGMIHRSNEREVENALKAISYLARAEKEDQHLRARIPGMRCFG
ncbi:YagK/YfjJ domain-containing protein [Alkanindiges illinoisensis]|uniref:Inovirus Gp2 family protein n=1 Tax=Alkanindiges illinoisensis TaxID=197183 RepID=A0A4Y7XD07_9GAMM|nr:inovirus-type Gp2 protein [Alkanindiges illinoisensis]TEU28524.1 inovirus Gp2 family protein [Alkanindiges illinoisensis]